MCGHGRGRAAPPLPLQPPLSAARSGGLADTPPPTTPARAVSRRGRRGDTRAPPSPHRERVRGRLARGQRRQRRTTAAAVAVAERRGGEAVVGGRLADCRQCVAPGGACTAARRAPCREPLRGAPYRHVVDAARVVSGGGPARWVFGRPPAGRRGCELRFESTHGGGEKARPRRSAAAVAAGRGRHGGGEGRNVVQNLPRTRSTAEYVSDKGHAEDLGGSD